MLLRDAPSRRASKHAASTRCRSSLLIVFSKEGLPSRLERSALSEEVIPANAPHAGSCERRLLPFQRIQTPAQALVQLPQVVS
eukprot:s8313_g1.t1